MMEPQAVDGAFEATRTILAPMPMLGIPEVLADEGRGLWSVRQPGVEVPRVYRCADIRSCQVYEVEGEQQPVPEGLQGIGEIFMNPMAVSRANMARRGDRIFGVGVLVEMAGLAEPVRIGIWSRPLKRGSRSYRNVMGSAEELKSAIEGLMVGESDG